MCGIAGVFAPGAVVSGDVVREMTESLVHRGPDGEGYHYGPQIGLGNRRLAIMDPAGGKQPLYDEGHRVVVVFNGEIYNHAELRRWVGARGHKLTSATDGAVLPHLYEEIGPHFVERLNGIFAIALWDREREALYLYRDKFGVKPLYWHSSNNRVSFASEIKALLRNPVVGREIDPTAVDHFLTYRFLPSPYTPFEGVRKLPPATMLTCTASDVREEPYWTATASGHRRDRHRLVEEYADAFERAVLRQTMSDQPIGVMLSGGVDSGAITAVLAAHTAQVRTFTIGFSTGGDTDEVPLARETARRFGAEHESLVLGPSDYLDALPRALRTLEEPVGSNSALAVNFVAELMRPTVPVALCGQGADEPMGGYWRHLGLRLAITGRKVPGLAAVSHRLRPPGRGVRFARGLQTLDAAAPLDQLMAAYRLFGEDAKRRLYKRQMVERVAGGPEPSSAVERLRARVDHLDPLGQMLYVDTRLWLPDELLLIADKMSMAASVELRVPFLDEDLVGLIESMDSGQKVRGLSRKSLHKRAMLRWLPQRVVYRKERGWQTPVDAWLRKELRPLLEDVLLSDGELCRELFEERELRRLIGAHAGHEADHTRELFCLLSLGLCYRELADVGT